MKRWPALVELLDIVLQLMWMLQRWMMGGVGPVIKRTVDSVKLPAGLQEMKYSGSETVAVCVCVCVCQGW